MCITFKPKPSKEFESHTTTIQLDQDNDTCFTIKLKKSSLSLDDLNPTVQFEQELICFRIKTKEPSYLSILIHGLISNFYTGVTIFTGAALSIYVSRKREIIQIHNNYYHEPKRIDREPEKQQKEEEEPSQL